MKRKQEQEKNKIPKGLDDLTIKDILLFKDYKRAYRIMMESTILY